MNHRREVLVVIGAVTGLGTCFGLLLTEPIFAAVFAGALAATAAIVVRWYESRTDNDEGSRQPSALILQHKPTRKVATPTTLSSTSSPLTRPTDEPLGDASSELSARPARETGTSIATHPSSERRTATQGSEHSLAVIAWIGLAVLIVACSILIVSRVMQWFGNLPNGGPVASVRLSETEGTRFATFSPDGKTIVSTSDGSVVFWDVASRQRSGQPLRYAGPLGLGGLLTIYGFLDTVVYSSD